MKKKWMASEGLLVLALGSIGLMATSLRAAAPRLRPIPIKDDLRRGMAILKESTPLYSKPSESSEAIENESLEIERHYFVLGLSLDGQWAQLLTRKNVRGWVLLSKIQRLPESDPELHGDFLKLIERQHWVTNRFSANLGIYPTNQNILGEFVFSVVPRGFSGLKGESFDLIAGGVWVKKTSHVGAHLAYRALLQWPFRSGVEGNFYIGPRLGYEKRRGYDSLSVDSVRTQHNGIVGMLFRYMPNSVIGYSLMPEFLIQFTSPNKAIFHAAAAITVMF